MLYLKYCQDLSGEVLAVLSSVRFMSLSLRGYLEVIWFGCITQVFANKNLFEV